MKSVGELIEDLEAENAKLKKAASRQSRSKALLAELFADLQRIDETSIMPDGDWVSVCVATWAAEWVKRLKDAGFITANVTHDGRRIRRTVQPLVGTSIQED